MVRDAPQKAVLLTMRIASETRRHAWSHVLRTCLGPPDTVSEEESAEEPNKRHSEVDQCRSGMILRQFRRVLRAMRAMQGACSM
jgi:hypothetical protein